MAIKPEIISLIMAQQTVPDQAMQVFLAAKGGTMGVFGLKSITDNQVAERKERDEAQEKVTRQKKTLEAGARQFLGLQKGAVVSVAQRQEFELALTEAEDKEDAPPIILQKDDMQIDAKIVKFLDDARIAYLNDPNPSEGEKPDFPTWLGQRARIG
jgi:hypothetical protein